MKLKIFGLFLILSICFVNSSAFSKTKYKYSPKTNIQTIQNKKTKTVKNISTNKKLAEKDITLEGKIEKTKETSLYHGQSDKELQQLVNSVGKKLLKANNINKKVYFKYSAKPDVNANVNVANTVTVYKGLIKKCNTEDELAYVIGHELGHSKSMHVAKGIAIGVGSSIANAAAVKGISHATNNNWAISGVFLGTKLATTLGKKKVSRIYENNADTLSIDFIVKAGYNPLASIAIMNKIGTTYLDVLSDHPSTEKRIINMHNYIKKNYPLYFETGYNSASYEEAVETYILNNQYY